MRTAQQVADKIAIHLLTQKKQATRMGLIAWTDEGGSCQCAWASLLGQDETMDDVISATLQSGDAFALTLRVAILQEILRRYPDLAPHTQLINDFARIHDDIGDVRRWPDECKKIYTKHDLNPSIVDMYAGGDVKEATAPKKVHNEPNLT